nr:25-hydroxyvitamin D-1 alpha hydroxylase, mitochondrial [Pelodiscus sinensis]|eukprot:XP_025035711.1 25-hydroxyvitamin D-1 alpha hydroxylase, mitochondrial [Pelodiscus sinensis]
MPQTLKLASRASLLSRAFPEILAELGFKAPVRVIKTHKTLEDMPGPSALSFFRDLFCKRGLARLHELQMEGKAKYGPVWKASFGPILTVHVAEPSLIEQVLRQEGKHPIRSDLSSWKDYRVCRGHAFGLLTAEGEEWQKIRSILGKHMLKPKEVESYTGTLRTCRAKGHIDKRMAEVAEKVSRGETVDGKYLTYYLAQEKLSMKSIYGNVTELLLAGVDTISSTLSWSLYELSRHPRVQAALHEEITGVMKGGAVPSAADVAQMPLLKAVVKEILMHFEVKPEPEGGPVRPMTRTLLVPETDINLQFLSR